MPPENQSLLDFIDAVKAQGATDEFVVALLRQNGWSERRIFQAFTAWYETRTGKQVPNGGGRIEAAKDAFLYLLAFITLGVWTIYLGAVFFEAIDRTFPNQTLAYASEAYVSRNLTDDLAGVIVGFPLFLLVTWLIARAVSRQPERLESPVRKWLTYIALVIAASTMIGDIVTFLSSFLRGDLDIRFVLKVATVLVIAGGVFTYYLDSLRPGARASSRNRLFAMAAFVIVGLGIADGFFQTGSPSRQRAEAADARRIFDLSWIAKAVQQRWVHRGQTPFVLPATILDIQPEINASARIVDPATNAPYRYNRLQGTAYELCTVFSRPSPDGVPVMFKHPAGYFCFDLDATKNIADLPYPPMY